MLPGHPYAWVLPLVNYFVPGLPSLISLVYFLASPRTQLLSKRLLTSAHGVSVTALWLIAAAFYSLHISSGTLGLLFVLLALGSASLIMVSLVRYQGPKGLHILVLFEFPAFIWALAIGVVAAT
jgi:hypothetical protein